MAELGNTVNYHQFEQSSPETVIVQKLETLLKKKKRYNKNETFVIEDTSSVTLNANTYHSYDISVTNGSADITESGSTYTLHNNHSHSIHIEADELLENSVVITGKSSGTVVIIRTLR